MALDQYIGDVLYQASLEAEPRRWQRLNFMQNGQRFIVSKGQYLRSALAELHQNENNSK